MWYLAELLAIVAIYTFYPAIGVRMNEALTKLIAWAKSHIGTRKDAS
ncbi:MAG TPA: hypothetical protein VFH85_07810 [Gammaproteobacteria bacterium]|nr:hypothetical protein [Gammaproteobacteria bacterium]